MTALVMELVEGPTLADRIAAGAIPVDEALAIAKQITGALESAHEHGIIHRDLKPANIKLRPDGTVKVLDFGLAKALTGEAAADQSLSPTITAATRAGVILGTAAYMAPEQARGKNGRQARRHLAFGCVLYEMLTAAKAFGGEEVSETLAFVITREPDWSALPAGTPEPVRRLLRRSLEKDQRKRLADVWDERLEIEEGQTARAPGVMTVTWLDASGKATPLGMSLDGASSLAFSPDGEKLAVDVLNGRNQNIAVYDWKRGVLTPLTVEPLADLRPASTGFFGLFWQRADGTGDVQSLLSADTVVTPFANSAYAEPEPMFSPDGKWLAFVSGESGRFQVHVRPFPGPGRGWIVSDDGGSAPTWSRTRQELFYAQPGDPRIMVVPYTIVGDAFRADRPRRRTDVRVTWQLGVRTFDLHPDAKRIAAALAEEPVAQPAMGTFRVEEHWKLSNRFHAILSFSRSLCRIFGSDNLLSVPILVMRAARETIPCDVSSAKCCQGWPAAKPTASAASNSRRSYVTSIRQLL